MDLSRVSLLLGIPTLRSSSNDVWILYASRFLRTWAFGSTGLILAVFLSTLGHSETRIGLFMTLTLTGDVLLSLVLTTWADQLGRRRTMALGSILMTLSGLVFTFASDYWILLAAAIFGVVSPSGNEIGPFRAVEEGMLANLVSGPKMSDVFAWYVVSGTAGVSFGTFSAGWMMKGIRYIANLSELQAYRCVFGSYTVIGMAKFWISTRLSEKLELSASKKAERHSSIQDVERQNVLSTKRDSIRSDSDDSKKKSRLARVVSLDISSSTWTILWKLCLMFTLDSFASGLVAFSLLSLYLNSKFKAPITLLSSLLAIPFLVSAVFSLLASPLSKRIGLLPTMAFTHLPSSILLSLLPLASTLTSACILLVIRSALSTMDQGPRTVFLTQVVKADERVKVMGVVNTVKTIAQSGGPMVTGYLATKDMFGAAFSLGGILKIGYDIMLMTFWYLSNQGQKYVTPVSPTTELDTLLESETDDDDDDDSNGYTRNINFEDPEIPASDAIR